MKRYVVAALTVAAVVLCGGEASARQSIFDTSLTNQGLFGGRSTQDGTIDLREHPT